MTVCVFIGPTLPIADGRALLAAEYLPPVRQGDVYRAVHRYGPRAIGIVDGYFHQVPSVWHKEILWAMTEGVHVFGSASMGALRAAELHPFGMQGVGRVFAAFRDRILEDDDEVAVVHAPEELGFVAASEAMVNIRWTLDAAKAGTIVGAETLAGLKGIAKSLFYPKRTYPEILKRGVAAGLPEGEIAALDAWLEHGRLDVKRDDALEMLRCMRDTLGADLPAKRVAYAFEHTTMWDAAVSAQRTDDGAWTSDTTPSIDDWLMDEIRLNDTVRDELRSAALLRLLVRREADRRELRIHDDERRQATTDFRLDHALHRGADLRAWLAEHDLDQRTLEELVDDKLLIEKIASDLRPELLSCAIDQLRTDGDDAGLIARARLKQQLLESTDDDLNLMDDLHALTWYFDQRVGSRMLDDLDAYAIRCGFTGAADFRRAVMREFRYQLISDET